MSSSRIKPVLPTYGRHVEGGASVAPVRHIPPTWFKATTRATTMCFLSTRSAERLAPLGEGERYLGWFVLPPFQRPPVWTLAQQARFVESCWMGLPIGVFVYNRTERIDSPRDAWLLDGQQRMTAVLSYMDDGFPVFGRLFSELTDVDRRFWSLGVSFPCMETNIDDEAQLREVYDRLAYGGTAHETK